MLLLAYIHKSTSHKGWFMTRHRESTVADDIITTPVQHYITWTGKSVVTDYTGVYFPNQLCPFSSTAEMDDVVTPNFHARMKRGEIINNPMSRTTVQLFDTEGAYNVDLLRSVQINNIWYVNGDQYRCPTPSVSMTGGWFCPLTDIEDETDRCKNIAVTASFAAASQAEILVLPLMAEFASTVETLKSLLNGVVHFARLAKKLSVSELLGNYADLDDLANKWMEIRYGLRPLMYDAIGAVAAFNKLCGEKGAKRKVFRGNKSYTTFFQDTSTKVWNGGVVTAHLNGSASYTIDARAGVMATVEFSKAGILGLDAIAESIWEVVPLSFVFDWFFNFAKLIASWSPKFGVKILTSWVVLRTTSTQITDVADTTIDYPIANPYSVSGDISGHMKKVTTSVTREVNPARPILPEIDIHFDLAKLLDLAIILKQLTA